MDDLTPTYERESRQVILAGRPAGPAGEAALVPVTGVNLAFDRIDGRLVRAIIDADGALPAPLLSRLFGPDALAGLGAVAQGDEAVPRSLSPQPGLSAALSGLARLDAARATSPVPPGSPWWAAEAAVLAEPAGLTDRAAAEAGRAIRSLNQGQLTVPPEAAAMAFAAAAIAAARDPEAAGRLKGNVVVDDQFLRPGLPGLDAAAEVERLRQDCGDRPGPHWVLDPGLIAPGLLRPGLSPDSDLLVRCDSGASGLSRLVVQATLAPGADRAAVGRCQARLVQPDARRVLATAAFEPAGSRAEARLELPDPLDQLGETWLEVFEGPPRRVRHPKTYLVRRALRWADAALRAERAPAGLAPLSTEKDWAALAALAWQRCGRDWAAAGDRRLAAALPAGRLPRPGPACLAEVLGR